MKNELLDAKIRNRKEAARHIAALFGRAEQPSRADHRRAQFREIDGWLQHHPWWSWGISVLIALAVLALSTALNYVLYPKP